MNPNRLGFSLASKVCHGLLTIFFVTTIISLCGCGDSAFEDLANDDTYEAQMEEATIALDDSDFSRAIEILQAMEAEHPDDQQVKQYLSNAYAGLAGLDTYNLLETIDELDDAGQSGSIDIIGTVLGDTDGRISATDVTTKLNFLDSAISFMDQTIVTSTPSAFGALSVTDDDRVVQRGVLAMSRIVLLMADMIIDQLTLPEIIMTETGIQLLYADQAPDFDNIFSDEIQAKFNADIQAIADAISAISNLTGTDNDLHEDFETFLNDLDQDGNRIIDQAEIESYLLDIING